MSIRFLGKELYCLGGKGKLVFVFETYGYKIMEAMKNK